MDIEEVAKHSPEKIIAEPFDAVAGLYPYQARKMAYALGFDAVGVRNAEKFLPQICKFFVAYDCSMVEINPLILTEDSQLLALDGKVSLDENAEFRHKEWEALRDAGLRVVKGNNDLLYRVENYPIDLLRVRDDDIPTFVADGVCDLGIVGENVLEEVRNGTYRPHSPSPPPPIPAPMSASMLRRKASSPPPAAYVNPAPQLQQRRDEDVIAAQDEDVQPSAFARYMNALLFPGLPQLLMRPFVIEDALIGAVLMLVAAIGWLFLVQAYFGTSSAVVTAQSPGDASYAQYWPLLVHVASLLHMLSIKTK
jgi:hypothetical protein